MANHASQLATQFGVPHVTTSIPWGVHPFPAKPVHSAVEVAARRARYNRLFDAMTTLQASCLALGQHADDQIETMILRMGFGSGTLGASGMPFVRRWGMGGGNELDFQGYEGMRRFMVRPFLEISKVRPVHSSFECKLTCIRIGSWLHVMRIEYTTSSTKQTSNPM